MKGYIEWVGILTVELIMPFGGNEFPWQKSVVSKYFLVVYEEGKSMATSGALNENSKAAFVRMDFRRVTSSTEYLVHITSHQATADMNDSVLI